jgi:hypothetical protein
MLTELPGPHNELVDTENQAPARLNIIIQVWDFILRMLWTLKGVISGDRVLQ